MPKFRRKNSEIVAHQWFKNGDHPADGPADKEGKVVRRYRHPFMSGEVECVTCGQHFNDHGWIDEPFTANSSVCPGDWVADHANNQHSVIRANLLAAQYDEVEP